jgi:hypothetical protein
VGAIWSNPADPDALGGMRVKALRVRNVIGDAKLLASARAGRFFLNDALNGAGPGEIGEPKATRLVAAEGAR